MDQALVFASIILGVAISDQVLSLHRLLRSDTPVRWHWAQPWFALIVLLTNVMIWWSLAAERGSISIGRFLPLLIELILLALLTVSSLPDGISAEGVDLAAFYRKQARYQWGLLALAALWTVISGAILDMTHGASPIDLIVARSGDLVAVAVMAGMMFARRWWLVACGMALMMIGPLHWLSRSVG